MPTGDDAPSAGPSEAALDVDRLVEELRAKVEQRRSDGSLSPERWGDNSPIRRAGEMHGPVLGLFGGADEGIPPDQVEAFDHNLAEAGVEHEIVTYPGAPHSFFDRRYEEHAEACADAWRRILAFL